MLDNWSKWSFMQLFSTRLSLNKIFLQLDSPQRVQHSSKPVFLRRFLTKYKRKEKIYCGLCLCWCISSKAILKRSQVTNTASREVDILLAYDEEEKGSGGYSTIFARLEIHIETILIWHHMLTFFFAIPLVQCTNVIFFSILRMWRGRQRENNIKGWQ